MNFLVTGFGPFRDVVHNPSSRLAEALPGNTEILSVQYGKVEAFARSVRQRQEDTILCLGQNSRSDSLRFELYAHNHIGTERGHGSRGHTRTRIRPAGPKTLGQTLLSPVQLGLNQMQTSYTPGDYVCNFLLYSLLIRYPGRRIGFVHVPPLAAVPFEDQLAELRTLIQLAESS